MTPYAKELLVVTTASNQIVPVPYPGRCTLDRLNIARLDTTGFSVNIYSRSFTTPPVKLKSITGFNGLTLLTFCLPFACKVGDVVTVSGTTTYDTDHRVTAIGSDYVIYTDQSFSSNTAGGVGYVNIPAGEQGVYLVAGPLTSSGSLSALTYVNQDPLVTVNIGVKRMIYLQFQAAGTYKFSLVSREGIATG